MYTFHFMYMCVCIIGRISYTRDFLIGLANCPEAQKKPEFLPNHPIVLMAAVSWMLLIGFMVASPMNILLFGFNYVGISS